MAPKKGAILEPLLAKAIGLGADQLEVEYKDVSIEHRAKEIAEEKTEKRERRQRLKTLGDQTSNESNRS